MRIFILYLLFLSSLKSFSQSYIHPNETNVFSFQTISGKKVVIVKDTSNKYLAYRFGTSNKIEFEFPTTREDSWNKFEYSFYLRGGGTANEGMDLNYLYFTNDGYKYIIYSTYFANNNQNRIGIKVIQLINNKTTDIKGVIKSQKGSLIDFRDNPKIKQGEELFD